MPFTASASAAALTVTVCALFQLAVVNVSDAESTVRSVSPATLTAMVTLWVGCFRSRTVYVRLLPSGTVTSVFDTDTPAALWPPFTLFRESSKVVLPV